jgi:endonuclease/exonuclease/phosphatase (EEP) superfamily protein YafD
MVKFIEPLKVLLYGLLSITAVLSVGSLFCWSYPLELFCNFRVYYLLLAGGMAFTAGIGQFKGLRLRLPFYLALALIAFNSLWVLPWYLPSRQQGTDHQLRLLTFNINVANRQWDEIARAIAAIQPDVAAVVESSAESKLELAQRLEQFPFTYRASGGGLTILSRLPLLAPQSQRFDHGTILLASVAVEQQQVQLVVAHAMVPVKPRLFEQRNAFLAELTAYIQQQPQRPLILLGDLNLTPWSPYYNSLVSGTRLHNTRLGFGVEPSWIEAASYLRYPNWLTALIKIPIDHILVSSEIRVSDCQTRQAANSDHRMLWSDLDLKT